MRPDPRALVADMCRHIGEEFPASLREMKMRQGLSLAEEAGEAVGALRRYLGAARRSGTLEELEDELADVVFSAYLLAHYVGSDLDTAITRKAKKIFTRGWREEPREPTDGEMRNPA